MTSTLGNSRPLTWSIDNTTFLLILFSMAYLNESRFARVIMSLSAVDFANFLDNCHLLFREATDENKLIMFNSISARENCDDLFERLYLKNTKDKLYYAWIMRQFNKKLNS